LYASALDLALLSSESDLDWAVASIDSAFASISIALVLVFLDAMIQANPPPMASDTTAIIASIIFLFLSLSIQK
jgi:hypothetical protein